MKGPKMRKTTEGVAMTPRRTVKRIALVLAVSTVVATAAGCGGSASGGSSGGGSGSEAFNVAWLPGTEVPMYAARAVGAFKKEGVNPKFIRFENGPAMNAAFKSGSVDIGYSGTPGFLTALTTGTKMQWVAIDGDNDHEQGLVARPGSGIKSVKDLAGRKVAAPIGTTAWMGLKISLEDAGMSLSDIKFVDLKTNAMVAAFQRGDVDAIHVYAPWLYKLQSVGGTIVQTDDTLSQPADISGWFGRTDWLKSNPKQVVGFLRALQDGVTAMKEQPNIVAEYMSKQLGLPKAVVLKEMKNGTYPTVKQQLDQNTRYSMTSPDGIQKVLKQYETTLSQAGLLQGKADLNGVVTSNYLKMISNGS